MSEKPPDWFVKMGPLLGAAQHQDRINTWPWWARLGHWLLFSWRCPACRYWKER